MRKLAILLFILLTCLAVIPANAQQYKQKKSASTRRGDKNKQVCYLGLGLGLDHGGIGLRVEAVPVKYLGIFGGLGYNFYGLGYNAGLSFKTLPDKPVCPVVVGMYGYNAVIVYKDGRGKIFNGKTYFGPTVGTGIEVKAGRARSNKFNALILVPFRNERFREDADAAGVSPLPVAFSVGFAWGIQ